MTAQDKRPSTTAGYAAPSLRRWRGGFLLALVTVILAHAITTLWIARGLHPLAPDAPKLPTLQAVLIDSSGPKIPPLQSRPPTPQKTAAHDSTSAESLQKTVNSHPAPANPTQDDAPQVNTPLEPEPPVAEPASTHTSEPQPATPGTNQAILNSGELRSWPLASRLHYEVTGQRTHKNHTPSEWDMGMETRETYAGQASVEWQREDAAYQTKMDLTLNLIGLEVFRRQSTSSGLITPSGLTPQSYNEAQKAATKSPRQQSLVFDENTLRLHNGQQVPKLSGVQDSVSQFGQMAYLLSRHYGTTYQIGDRIELPLALPNRQSVYLYEIVEEVVLSTPVGDIPTLHVKPLKTAGGTSTGKDFTAEIWFARTYQYMPIKIRLQQGNDAQVDLLIDQIPEALMDAPAVLE